MCLVGRMVVSKGWGVCIICENGCFRGEVGEYAGWVNMVGCGL